MSKPLKGTLLAKPLKGLRASIFHLHYLPYRSNELCCKVHLLRGQFLCHLASLESYSQSIFYSTSGAGGCRSLKLPTLKNAEGSSHMGRDSSAFFISCFLIARSTVSRALLQCTDHSHCFSTSFSLFKSSGLAICSFMPVFFASCTSSAKAFAVMAMMGTLPRLPASARIAAVAS